MRRMKSRRIGDPGRLVLPEVLPEAETAPARADLLGQPVDINDAAAIIGCSSWTVRHVLIPQGLPHFRAGRNGKLIFYRQQITRWIVRHQRAQGGTL